jgi:hypothetical protein
LPVGRQSRLTEAVNSNSKFFIRFLKMSWSADWMGEIDFSVGGGGADPFHICHKNGNSASVVGMRQRLPAALDKDSNVISPSNCLIAQTILWAPKSEAWRKAASKGDQMYCVMKMNSERFAQWN